VVAPQGVQVQILSWAYRPASGIACGLIVLFECQRMIVMADRATIPELLSPAGDWDAMNAAVLNGANAVYFGLENFNARHRATNFTVAELPDIVGYLHDHNVKGFITFNTLIFSDELPAAVDYILAIASAGGDAVIVQDLGLARLIHAIAPTLAIHGSTQMTLTEPRGIQFVQKLGVQRVVLARELSLIDIGKIVGSIDMPVEVFIHGALCVAYSGQCLTSEALGGRSANRGQCAQACRLPYELIVDGEVKPLGDKAYLLSPQDLAAHDLIGDLSRLGVKSLKIEGRLKSAHYVAATTQTYRQALDTSATGSDFRIAPQQRADLEQTFSRGFSHGFLSGVNHQELVVARFPKSRGRRIGVVRHATANGILLNLQGDEMNPLKPGDGVVFDEGHPDQDEQGGRVFAVHPRGHRQIEIELGRGDVNPAALSPNAIVWKTDDPALRKRLEHSFSRDSVVNRLPLRAVLLAHVGQKLSIRFIDASVETTVTGDKPLERAMKFPFSPDQAREQLSRLGDTPYELTDLSADVSGDPMVPKSVLNDLRRQAVADLLEQRSRRRPHAIAEADALNRLRREAISRSPDTPGEGWGEGDFERKTTLAMRNYPQPDPHSDYREREPKLHVLVRSLEHVDALLNWQSSLRPSMLYCDFEDIRKYPTAIERCRAAGMPIGLATLRIIKPGEEGFLKQIADCDPDAVLVRSVGAIELYRETHPHLPLIGDYSLNIYNELSAKIFTDAGLVRLTPSYDLNWKQMSALFTRFPVDRFEVVVHQHIPMFHMEHCVFAHTLSNGKDFHDCGRPCETHQVELRDRVGQPHPLLADVGCRNTLYNAQSQSAAEYIPQMLHVGVSHFRVELLREDAATAVSLLQTYVDALSGRTIQPKVLRSLRVLNQLGVTAGTLERD
jgi:putative protease